MDLIDPTDVMILAGFAIIAVGVWWIYPPAALIFVGLGMILLGLALA